MMPTNAKLNLGRWLARLRRQAATIWEGGRLPDGLEVARRALAKLAPNLRRLRVRR